MAAKTRLQTTTQTLLKNQINARLKQIEIQIRQVDAVIAEKIAQDKALSHRLAILISIPGIAKTTARGKAGGQSCRPRTYFETVR